MSRARWPGTAEPLGAHWDGHGVNFAVFSANATKVELCLFDRESQVESEHIDLERSDDVWHVYLPGCTPGTIYGYRAHGPYQPKQGHRFNAHKLLIDPYARQLSGSLRWDDSVYAYDLEDQRQDLSIDNSDNASFVPKSVVVDESFDWGRDKPPRIPWPRTVMLPAFPACTRKSIAEFAAALPDLHRSLPLPT